MPATKTTAAKRPPVKRSSAKKPVKPAKPAFKLTRGMLLMSILTAGFTIIVVMQVSRLERPRVYSPPINPHPVVAEPDVITTREDLTKTNQVLDKEFSDLNYYLHESDLKSDLEAML